ncbi:MAG: DUF2905 domain-containing protein [Gammaproteobacteria bacterium]|nr:DUF2905 domain-containing protein [Gammaproteobacteria bacterium]MDE0247583.1 DUF2905 domain-containing protein [Gammaproteobacteria bacterium]
MGSPLGPVLVGLGGVLVLAGLLVWSNLASWIGHLPGDIRIVRPNTRIYIPITSMVILSVILSVVLALLRRFL